MAENGGRENRRPTLRAERPRKEPGQDGSAVKSELPHIVRRLEQAELGARYAAGTARREIAHALAHGDAAALAKSVEDLVVIRMDLKRLEDFRTGADGAAGSGVEEVQEEAPSAGGEAEEAAEDDGEDNAANRVRRNQHVFLERNPWFDLLSDGTLEGTVRAFARVMCQEGMEPDETDFWIELEKRIHAHLQGRADASRVLN